MRAWVFALLATFTVTANAAATPQYDVIAALQNLRAGRNDDALALLTQAIESRALKESELADALEWRAFVHGTRRNPRAARADLDAATQAESANPLRYRARARFLMRNGDFRAALADIDAVMARAPTDAENLTDWCEILIGLGRRADAIDRCRRALKVNPEYARAKAMLRRAGGR